MNQTCEEIQGLISGLLDEELTPEDLDRVERHIAGCPACREELENMKLLMAAASGLEVQAPPEEVWDTFLDNVYNRIERKTGWLFFTVGVIVLAVYASYHFVVDDWAGATEKTLIAAPIIGLAVLFVSVLRQRLFVRRTDRYSREIKR